MKSNSRVLRGWRDFGVKATAIILTILLATQMVGTPAFASGALTNKQASEDIATTVDDTGVEPSGTEATDTTVPDEAAGAANEPAPADSTQATEEPVVETVESATEPATETPAADPAANAVSGTEPEPAPAPAVEQDQLASIKLNLADGASITLSKDGNKIDDDTNPVDVPANEELKFTAAAPEGMQISAVKTFINGVESDPISADENGEYTVAAEDVTDGLTVKVETSAVEGETPSEGEEAPAEDAAEAGDEESTDPAAEDATPAEPEVLDSEKVVADVSSPAYEGYAYVGDIVVKVTAAEGVLPEGTTVSAYQVNRQDVIDAVSNVVEQNGKVVENSVAIDVTLLGPDGNVIQPDGAVNVCFFNTSFGGGEVDVYRVSDDASTVQAVGTRQADSDVQSFDVNHFSIYVGAEIKAAATYKFYNGDSCVATQLVKDGDLLVEPASPTADGKTFLHWAINGTQLNFDQTISVSEPGLPVRVDAVFADAAYIFFMDGVGEGARVVRTKQGVAGATDTVDDVTFPVDASHGITGWYYDQSLDNPVVNNSVTYGIEPIILYPKVDEGHYITFVSNGGSYVAPDFYLSDKDTVEPDDPTRAGYDFKGWTTDEKGNTPFNWGQAINGSITLYAQWDARRDTKYTVIYWVENANDEEYSFYKSETKTGTSGEITDVMPSDRDIYVTDAKDIFGETAGESSGWWEEKRAYPYHVSLDNQVQNAAIAGDGSTIVNVYYDRNSYTLTFKEGNGWYDDTLYTITKKWGESISKEEWPSSSKQYTNSNWSISSSRFLAYTSTMPYGGGELWVPSQARQYVSADYYVEALSPDDYGADGKRAEYNQTAGKYFILHHTDEIYASSDSVTVGNEDRYAITGFELIEGRPSTSVGSYYRNADFYYSRSSLNIIYINNGSEAESLRQTYKFGADISDAGNVSPSRPSGIPENYEFQGWYADPEGTIPFVFDGKTMPANNITVYAKWSAPTHTVNFYG